MSEKIKQVFNVDKMKCGGCTSTVEKVLNDLSDTDLIEVSLENNQAIVMSSKSAQEIADVISASGFPATAQ